MRIVPSSRKEKKFMAIFSNGKVVHFGAKNYTDFILSGGDVKRKQRYLARHRKRENWNDPMTPGSLSRWILWNKPTLRASIEDYYHRFKNELEKKSN